MQRELAALLERHRDGDGLVKGTLFDDVDQENVRVGAFWVGIDVRVPWTLAQFLASTRQLWAASRLRLDERRIEPDREHMSPIRKAYWWGPKFDLDKVDEQRTSSTCVHGDETAKLWPFEFVAKTKFHWDYPRDEPLAVLQIEEFAARPQDADGRLVGRYLHSMRNRVARRFTHFDVAHRGYDRASYERAYNETGIKGDSYTKLLRVDGDIDNETWFNLVASFFSDNPLVREYFGGR